MSCQELRIWKEVARPHLKVVSEYFLGGTDEKYETQLKFEWGTHLLFPESLTMVM